MQSCYLFGSQDATETITAKIFPFILSGTSRGVGGMGESLLRGQSIKGKIFVVIVSVAS